MKAVKYIVLWAFLIAGLSCDPYRAEMDYLMQELDSIPAQIDSMKAPIQTLAEILDALQDHDFVTSVTPFSEVPGRRGYTLTFSRHGAVKIYFGADGADGADGLDGADGQMPKVGAKRDDDGLWYWTVNGEWLLNAKGEKMQVAGHDGITPLVKIVNQVWYISYDNGKTWEEAGSAAAIDERVFKDIDYETYDDYVLLTLMDGSTVEISKRVLSINIWNYDEISAGETVSVRYQAYSGDNVAEVACIASEGWSATVFPSDSYSGTIEITAPDPLVQQPVLVFASYAGQTVMRTIEFSDKSQWLSAEGSANCYIVRSPGKYKFDILHKGSSADLLDEPVDHLALLWESAAEGTQHGGALVSGWGCNRSENMSYALFSTPREFHEGNAVFAAMGSNNKVLWTWHIWFTKDAPDSIAVKYKGKDKIQVMDRDLGAFSSDPGSPLSLGLMYQWGRKDPFPGSGSVSSPSRKGTSASWSKPVDSSAETGRVRYTIANPMLYITGNSDEGDWMFTPDASLWGRNKTAYDPCPAGWQVMPGGTDGMWSSFPDGSFPELFDASRYGMLFGSEWSVPESWYQAGGILNCGTGSLESTGTRGSWWSADACVNSGKSYGFSIAADGKVSCCDTAPRAEGRSVRCCRMPATGSGGGEEETDLSKSGTSNCYIVPSGGAYKFRADVKGSTSKAIDGTPASASVLWESFGTSEKPAAGSIISKVSYSGGYVHFTMASPYRQGNALIAVKNSSGKILWSWHIWSCDFNASVQKKHVNGEYYMDRNLGALSAEPGTVSSLGLLYQWGRKDPFPGPSAVLDKTVAASTGQWDVNNEEGNNILSYTVEHPMTVVNANLMWAGGDELGWYAEKYENDPCPPGWRVPDSNPMQYDFRYDATGHGAWVNDLWFPSTGNNLTEVGIVGSYYRAMEYSLDSSYRHFSYTRFNFSGYQNSSSSYSGKRSVRCVETGVYDEKKYEAALDLSRNETANCYVVTAPGFYKFKADVEGNSDDALSISGKLYAPVVWETDNTTTAVELGSVIEQASYHSKYIYFRIPDNMREGNALIALADNYGTIRWSWHIWVTKTDPGRNTLVLEGMESYPVMDRNLGALSSDPGNILSNGLLYQWGRKDPFPGMASYTSNSYASKAGATGFSWTSSNTISLARQRPTLFICANSTDGDWIRNGGDDTLWSGEKSKYDPCPPGWRVPEGGELGLWSRLPEDCSYYWNPQGYGLLFGSAFSTPDLWLPAAGCINASAQGESSGKAGSVWTCTVENGVPDCLVFDRNVLSQQDAGKGKAYARSVRCCKDWGTEPSPVMNIGLKHKEITLAVGESFKLVCRYTPSNAVPNFKWSSSNGAVAKVDATSGIITAAGKGTCSIIVSSGEKSDTCMCNVTEASAIPDLSINEPANCYMVEPGGSGMFRPYKGNSRTLLEDSFSASVLWECTNSTKAPLKEDVIKHVAFQDGYVVLKAGNSSGNAMVAVMDSRGTILWSWHVWVTSYKPYNRNCAFRSGAVMMDRNLGALSANKGDSGSLGLMYQWGRKDPFPGSSDTGSPVFAKTCPANAWTYAVCYSITGNVGYSIKNPTVFIGQFNNDWLYDTYEYNKSRWGREKTVYDPCPQGWRVPDGGDASPWADIKDSEIIYDENNRGQTWSAVSSPQSWLPLSGFINGDASFHDVGYTGHLWTTDPSRSVQYGGTLVSESSSSGAQGHAVRCVREE